MNKQSREAIPVEMLVDLKEKINITYLMVNRIYKEKGEPLTLQQHIRVQDVLKNKREKKPELDKIQDKNRGTK